jgi:hypothetical protein
VELSRNHSSNQEAFVRHRNAALTPRARLRLARLTVDNLWPIAQAARRFEVSWRTADGLPPITRLTNLPGQHS